MNVDIEQSWKQVLSEYFESESWKTLTNFVRAEYSSKTVYPHPKNIFNAFNTTPFDKVRVVILGQDPYHGPGQAHGLSFSVQDGIAHPPSLRNILQEVESDIGQKPTVSGNLTPWAEQGVLLLNSVLSVEAHQAASHAGRGWEEFTDYVIKKLSDEKEHLVFILWGAYAQKKGSVIDRSKHLVLKAPHPSPLSAYRGFFGSKPFSQTNSYLESKNIQKIIW